jgi:hypothetical protein
MELPLESLLHQENDELGNEPDAGDSRYYRKGFVDESPVRKQEGQMRRGETPTVEVHACGGQGQYREYEESENHCR